MPGRRFLKRFTRLGLSVYLLGWCMSFTVCASDYPISDMVLNDSSIIAAAQDASGSEDTEPAGSSFDAVNDTQGPVDESDADEAKENDAVLENEEEGIGENAVEGTASSKDAIEDDEKADEEGASEDGAEADRADAEIADEDAEGEAAEEELTEDAAESDDCAESEDLLFMNGTFVMAEEIVNNITFEKHEFVTSDKESLIELEAYVEPWENKNLSRVEWKILDSDLRENEYLSEKISFSSYAPYSIMNNCSIKNLEESTTFYVAVIYHNEPGFEKDDFSTYNNTYPNPSDICKIEYIKPDPSVELKSFNLSMHDIVINNNTDLIRLAIQDREPAEAVITDSKMKVEILDSNLYPIYLSSDQRKNITSKVEYGEVLVNISKLYESTEFYVRCTYNISGYSSNQTYKNPSDICRIEYVSPDDEEFDVELPQTSMDVELFKTENIIPFSLRNNYSGDYFLPLLGDSYSAGTKQRYYLRAKFEDEAVDDLFSIDVIEGDRLNITLNPYFVYYYDTVNDINKLVKNKKYTSAITFCFRDGFDKNITTTQKLTLNIKRSVPTVKAGKLTLNPYLSGVGTVGYDVIEPVFTGAEVESFAANPAKALPAGICLNYSKRIWAYNLSEKAKSGKISVMARIKDDEWHLPGNNYVPVDIPYTVKNAVPKIKMIGASKASINPYLDREQEKVLLNISITQDPAKDLAVCFPGIISILDSKNKNASDAFDLGYQTAYDEIHGKYYVLKMNITDNAKIGETYKVKILPINSINSRTGAAVTATVKVLGTKDAGKVSVSLGTKGSINALDPSSKVLVTISGKNVALGSIYSMDADFGAYLADGTNVTNLFRGVPESSNQFYLAEADSTGDLKLIKNNLAGKKVNIRFNYRYYSEGVEKSANATKTITIGKGSVTPKFDKTKITLNPAYGEYVPVEFNLTGTNYNYSVNYSICSGKKVLYSTLRSTYAGENYSYGTSWFDLYDIPSYQSYLGKTLDVKLTPVMPDDISTAAFKELKTATLKVALINPKKTLVSASASTRGSIDALYSYSSAVITLKYKNTHRQPYSSVLRIYNASDKKKTDSSYSFSWSKIYSSNGDSVTYEVFRKGNSSLTPGSYKIEINSEIYAKNGSMYNITTTSSFKVVKSKDPVSCDRAILQLVNNNSKRDFFTLSLKDSSMNRITSVYVEDTNSEFKVEWMANGKFSLGFKNGRYVELDKKKKPITTAITKNVKIAVLQEGCYEPTIITVKVKILP